MNFAVEMTNPGQSLLYVCILLLSIHLLFNAKVVILLSKIHVLPKSFFLESNLSRIVPMIGQIGNLDPITIPTPNIIPISAPQIRDGFENL